MDSMIPACLMTALLFTCLLCRIQRSAAGFLESVLLLSKSLL